jgi:hypothetical protein
MSSLMLTPPSSAEAQPLRPDWVKALFGKLSARYGTLFADRYAGVPQDVLIAEWGAELAGLSGDDIRRGLDGCRDLRFPPTLPEFLALCRPPIEPHTAFMEAMRNMRERDLGRNPAWSHPAIYWAAVEVTHYDMRQSTYSAIRSRWERALADQLRHRCWPDIPRALVALPAPVKGDGPSAAVRAQLANLIKMKRIA